MSAAEYLEGLAFFAGTVGCVLVAATILVTRLSGHRDPVGRVLSVAVLATTGVIAAHLLPGVLGILSRTSALITAIGLLLLSSRVPSRARRAPARPPRPSPPSGSASWTIAALAVGAVAVASVAAAWTGAGAPSVEIDTLSFHLPNVARWIQSGSFWQIDVLAPLQPTGHYPHSGDVVVLSSVLPWRSDAFVRSLGLPLTAVAGLSVYAIATEIGAPRATAALVGALYASLPIVVSDTFAGAKTDPIALAGFGSGLFFLIRHFRTGHRPDLVLGGLGLGLAFGTKWYAVTSVAAVLLAWAGVSRLARRPTPEVLRNGAVLVATVAAAGGFWLLRNLVESGNPVFPVRVAAAGLELFDAPRDVMRDCGGFAVADYLGDPGIWRDYLWPAYRDRLGLPGLACVVAWVCALGLLAIPRFRHGALLRGERPMPLMLATVAGLLGVAYLVTPYTALGPPEMPTGAVSNVRWLGPAFLVGAALTGWVVGRAGRARLAAELVLLLAVADGLRRSFSDPVGPVAGGLAVVGVATVLGFLLARRRSRIAIAGVTVAAIAAIAIAGYERQRSFQDERYEREDPTLAWIARNAPAGHRVGLAWPWDIGTGISPIWPAFGPRFRNHVEYVGPFVDELMLEYPTRADFLRAVDRGRYDLLLIGKADYPQPARRECLYQGYGSDEHAWVRQAGYRKLVESDRLALYRVLDRHRGRGSGT